MPGSATRRDELLDELIAERGPSSETYGILGRVLKDLRDDALKADRPAVAKGHLNKAIEAYRKGFEADWRDAYPGINAVTLMELKEPPDPDRLTLLPVVSYAVERRVARGKPDYWDHATLLELAVLKRDEEGAAEHLVNALAVVREIWEPETTANNLRLIREARERRSDQPEWASEIENELSRAASVS